MEEKINEWKNTHKTDWKMIHGKQQMTKLEYHFIHEELERQGFKELIEKLEKAFTFQLNIEESGQMF